MVPRRQVIAMPLFALGLPAQPARKRSTKVREADIAQLERQILAAVNQRRTKGKLLPLVWSDLLAKEARRHSIAMLEGGFFSHRDPVRGDLEQRLNDSPGKIPWRRCAENLFESSATAPDRAAVAVQNWMESPGHRRNIMESSYTDSGVGVAIAEGGGYYVTQIFAWLLPAAE